jgi:hypothetical protein
MSDFSRLLEMALASDAEAAKKALGEPEAVPEEKTAAGKSGVPQQRSEPHTTQTEHQGSRRDR